VIVTIDPVAGSRTDPVNVDNSVPAPIRSGLHSGRHKSPASGLPVHTRRLTALLRASGMTIENNRYTYRGRFATGWQGKPLTLTTWRSTDGFDAGQ
jgi:hypothetical protein